ncbi:hypothetical protein PIB30_110850, partial [Stylosanthes scabra]|nr:hypothetical protein [Stylosanthes scabra]
MGSHTIVSYPDNFWNVDFYWTSCFRGGVVYDKFNDDYLVVMGSIRVNGHVIRGKPKSQWKLFSIRTNSWKDIEGGDYFIPSPIHQCQLGLLYNEAIHWLESKLSLLGGGGCFGICMMNNKFPEIWVMREYKVESSWTKLNIMFPCRNLFPLCCTKSDEVVGKLDGINHLIKFRANEYWNTV